MTNRILLFDMDHVLLEPLGYQRALIDTVLRIGYSLGFQDVNLSPQDVAYYEAAGYTSEWDTAAICAALLLKQVWSRHPGVRIPLDPVSGLVPAHDLPVPNMQDFARALAQSEPADAPLRVRTELLLTENRKSLSVDQRSALLATIRNARRFERSPTHRIFQELVLGSQAYRETYQTPPNLQVVGTLKRYDRPTLNPDMYRRLVAWLDHPNNSGAITTNRPSMAPDGENGTPEAETGARMVGLDHLPVVGLGALSWRSELDGLVPGAYRKPSPVHALTGLLMALGEPVESALEAAVALSRGDFETGWEILAGAEVWVFEDTAGELLSAVGAWEALAERGIEFKLSLCGVTSSAPKRDALLAVGAQVYPDLNAALSELFD